MRSVFFQPYFAFGFGINVSISHLLSGLGLMFLFLTSFINPLCFFMMPTPYFGVQHHEKTQRCHSFKEKSRNLEIFKPHRVLGLAQILQILVAIKKRGYQIFGSGLDWHRREQQGHHRF